MNSQIGKISSSESKQHKIDNQQTINQYKIQNQETTDHYKHNIEKMISKFQRKLAYKIEKKQWYKYKGTHWKPITDERISRYMLEYILDCPDNFARKIPVLTLTPFVQKNISLLRPVEIKNKVGEVVEDYTKEIICLVQQKNTLLVVGENLYGASSTDYASFKGYIESQVQEIIKQINAITNCQLKRTVNFLKESKKFSINQKNLAEESIFCLKNNTTFLKGFSKSDFQPLNQRSFLSDKTLDLLQSSLEKIAKIYDLDKYANTQTIKKYS